MNKSFLAGAIRRHESIRALKDRAQEPLPSFIQSTSRNEVPAQSQQPEKSTSANVTTLPCLHQAVEDLEKKKQQHLQLPAHKRGVFMRVSSIFIFLLILLVAALFFFGGYLYSYMHLPGPGPGISTAQYPDTAGPNWRAPQAIIPGTGALEAAPAGSSYLQRRAVLQKDQAVAEDVFTKGEQRSKAVAREQAKQVLANTTYNMTNTVRKIAGDRVANIFDPFAATVVAGTVGQVVDQKLNTKASTPQAQRPQVSPSGTTQTSPAAATSQQLSGPHHQTAQTTTGVDAATVAAGATETKSVQSQPPLPLYSVEVRTFEDDGTNAWALMNLLRSRGYPQAYVARESANNHLYFKVRIGHFTSYLDASRAREVLDEPSRVVVVELNENRLIE